MQHNDYFEFMCPVKTGSGYRALSHLPMDLSSFNASKPLIITEKINDRKGIVKAITKAFRTYGKTLGIYNGIDQMSNLDTVKELSGLYRDKGFDSIIVLGKGPAVSVAKLVNIVVSGSMDDLVAMQGEGKIQKPLRPLVFIPVSSGSAMACSGEIDFDGMYFSSKFLMPDVVTIDPQLIYDEEPESMLTTAMAALTYAAESYASPARNVFVESYAQLVIDFIMTHLQDTMDEGRSEQTLTKRLKNLYSQKTSRVALINASCMAGYVYENSPEGLTVKLAREIAKSFRISSGTAMGILLPYVLEYHAFREGIDLSKLMCPMVGLDRYVSTPHGQRFEHAMGKIRYILNDMFIKTTGMFPRTLEDAGVPKESLAEIAAAVAEQETAKDLTQACMVILEHAFYGNPVTH